MAQNSLSKCNLRNFPHSGKKSAAIVCTDSLTLARDFGLTNP
jgi:hypothetical protein